MPRPRALRTLLLAAAPLALLAPACSQQDDPTPEELTEDLADELQERDGSLTRDQAECFAELVVDEVGVDDIQDVELTDEDPPSELAEGIAAAAVEAREACDLTTAPG